MVKFPLNLSLKIIKTTVGFLREKELRLWSDLLTFKAEISLQQRLHFSDTKALQLWSDFLQIQAKPSLKNGWVSQIKRDCQYG